MPGVVAVLTAEDLPVSDLRGAVVFYRSIEEPGGSLHNLLQFRHVIVVEPQHQPEAPA